MVIQVKNCNSVYQGEINIVENALNVKYAINGTGKSTLAKAICAGIAGDEKALQALKPYAFLDKEKDYEPKVIGTDAFSSVMIFDEKYVDDFVFQPDELIKDSFSIFVKTPDYDRHMQEIGSLLQQINESFRTHPELDELIKVLGQFVETFGKTKAGVSKAGALYKSFGEGNKIQNVPHGLEAYSPYLTHAEGSQNVKWIKWQLQGEPFLAFADQCPYCTASIAASKEKILQIREEYDSKSVEHLNNMLQIFSILCPYFSDNTTKEINDITNNISGITKQQIDYLGGIRQQAESLLDALRMLKGIGFHSLKETERIADEIKGYMINLSYFSHFQSDTTREKIDVINHSLDDVLLKAGLLQGEINKQKILIQKTVEQNSERINGFLKSAGYQYEVLLEEDESNQFRLLLKPVNCGVKVNQVKEHLSFGERNAFALVLFMFSAIRENPDLVILDDPISSFDGNKKFAILNMLFLAKGACLRNRTVLLLTHEFNTVIDVIYTMPQNFQPKPHASFLSVNNHILTEQTIEKSDILSFSQLAYWNFNDPTLPVINKLIFFRRWLEAEGNKGPAWDFLSSLFHKREKPTKKHENYSDDIKTATAKETDSDTTSETEESEDNAAGIELNPNELSSVYELFDEKMILDVTYYEDLLKIVKDDAKLIQLYKSSVSNYEKLQIYRLIFQKHDNEIVKKFINESYHCENDYLFQLDPRKYDTVPQYIIDECDKDILEKELSLSDGQEG